MVDSTTGKDGAENSEAWGVNTARQGSMSQPGEMKQEPTRKVAGGVDQGLTRIS